MVIVNEHKYNALTLVHKKNGFDDFLINSWPN